MTEVSGKPEAKEVKETLWRKLQDGPFVMIGLTDSHEHSEPMTAQLDQDSVDTLWFFAGRDNRLAKGGMAMAQFVSKGQDFFACMMGNASVDQDRAQIDKLWNKQAEAWFPGGKDDPELALIRFDIASAELWETDLSPTARLKMLFGGTIDYSESSSHAVVETTAESSPA